MLIREPGVQVESKEAFLIKIYKLKWDLRVEIYTDLD